jgi:hypothetical protein
MSAHFPFSAAASFEQQTFSQSAEQDSDLDVHAVLQFEIQVSQEPSQVVSPQVCPFFIAQALASSVVHDFTEEQDFLESHFVESQVFVESAVQQAFTQPGSQAVFMSSPHLPASHFISSVATSSVPSTTTAASVDSLQEVMNNPNPKNNNNPNFFIFVVLN